MDLRPNNKEKEFLDKAYNYFLDIQEETESDSFWHADPYYRLSRIREAILIYSEVLDYEPVGWFLESLKKLRPSMEAELSKEYILFIRNTLTHFPFFKSWDDIIFTKSLINWSKPGKSIDNFLTKFSGHAPVKYRIWKVADKTMTYVSISFPSVYNESTLIRLNEFMPEKEGFLFIMSLMHRVLMSQVETINDRT